MLTEAGLHVLSVAGEEFLQLTRQSYTALPAADGMLVDGKRLVTWTDNILQRYEFVDDQGSLLDLGTLDAGGPVHGAVSDGELIWVLADGPYTDGTWQAFNGDERVALAANGADRLVFTGNAVYERVALDTAGLIRRRPTIAAPVDTAWAPSLEEAVMGIFIRDAGPAATLGGDTVAFLDDSGNRLAAWPVWRDQQRQWFLPRAALPSGAIEVVRTDRSGAAPSALLNRNESFLTQTTAVYPAATDTLVRGAWVPAAVRFDGQARVAASGIRWSGNAYPSAAATGAIAHQWLDVPLTGDPVAFGVALNGSLENAYDLALTDNSVGLEIMRISQPQPNQAFTEGGLMTVQFSASRESGEALHYTEVSLLDFNRNLIDRRLAAASDGYLTLRLPEFDAQQNLYVRVRAYYGDSYFFSESEQGIRVYPELQLPRLGLDGVGRRILAGSQLDVRINTLIAGELDSLIAVYDDQDQLLASDELRIQLAVPGETGVLRVRATVSDGLGNERHQSHTIEVIDPIGLSAEAESRPFQAGLADIGDAWFAQGRTLYDIAGQPRVTLESTVNAMDHLGDRLILALNDIGIVVVDPADEYRVLSRKPVAGHVSRLTVADNRALALIDGDLYGYTIAGNAVEAAGDITANGRVLDILARADRFVVLSSEEIRLVSGDFQTVQRLTGAFTALVQGDRHLFAATVDGKLLVIDENFSSRRFDLGLKADRLLRLQGDLLALAPDSETEAGRLQLVDVRNPRQPETIGSLAVELGRDVSRAFVAGGRIWIGDSPGAVTSLEPKPGAPELLYRSSRPRGNIRQVVLEDGTYLAAADHYGAVTLQQTDGGAWVERVHPAAFTFGTHAVAAAGEMRYLLQQDFRRVLALDPAGRETVVFKGAPFSHLLLTEEKVVVAAGPTLYLASRDLAHKDTVVVSAGDDIVSLAAAGESLLAGTVNGSVYRVDVGNFPIFQPEIQTTAILNAAEPIRRMTSDGDYLYYGMGSLLHRLRLRDLADEYLDLGRFVGPVTMGAGALWVAAGNEIYRIDATGPWQATPAAFLTAEHTVTALDAAHDRLLLGQGAYGLAVYQLSQQTLGSSAALYAPAANRVFVQTELIPLSLTDIGGINAVRYRIAGESVAVRTSPPPSRPGWRCRPTCATASPLRSPLRSKPYGATCEPPRSGGSCSRAKACRPTRSPASSRWPATGCPNPWNCGPACWTAPRPSPRWSFTMGAKSTARLN